MSDSVVHAALEGQSAPLTFAEVMSEWSSNPLFVVWWTSALRAAPFAAFCWETPPLTVASMNRPFEFVFVDSPALANARADAGPFAEHFRRASPHDTAVVFENLGKDALIVAPCPIDRKTDYAHLATFVRSAPDAHSHQLWHAVSAGLAERVSAHPIWLSTAGLGVSWLHIRMDSWPKYYRYRPYASPQFWTGIA